MKYGLHTNKNDYIMKCYVICEYRCFEYSNRCQVYFLLAENVKSTKTNFVDGKMIIKCLTVRRFYDKKNDQIFP